MTAWQLVLIQLITFAGLMIGLRMLFYRQLNAALQRLQVLQEEALVKEAQLKEELERAQKERAAEVERGKEEAKLLVETAKREADTLRGNVEEQSKQECNKILARGKGELDRARANLAAEIEVDGIRFALELVKHTLVGEGVADFQRHLINDLIQEIGHVDKDRFTIKTNRASVSSSVPLTVEEKRRLCQALSDKLNTEVVLEERIDPELITGLVVQVGSLILDGSLRNKLRKAVPLVRAANNRPAAGVDGSPQPPPVTVDEAQPLTSS